MKVSKSSWLYRYTYNEFTYFTWRKDPTDLCTYIRQVIKVTLFYTVVLGLVTSIPFGIYNHLMYGVQLENWPDYLAGLKTTLDGWVYVIAVLFAALWFMAAWLGPLLIGAAAALLLCAGLVYIVADVVWPKIKPAPKVNPKPSMVVEAYRGFKDKYCPVIELED